MEQQLKFDIGVISPQHIQSGLLELKTHSKNSYFAFLSDALALFENRGFIRLFNLTNSNGGKSVIPTIMPYFPGFGVNRVKTANYGESGGKDMAIFVNMYRIGHWSSDESTYDGVAASTDLYSCLESGVIGYKLLIQGMADFVFDNKSVIEYLTKIYCFMFAQAIKKAKTTFGDSPFQKDAANFLIARFFLLYVLGKTDSEYVDEYAYLVADNKSQLDSLKSFEEINRISYSSLSSFLKTFGEAFYNGEGVELISFENKWISLYGDATGLAIEYVPYLLHFLFAAMRNARLGGSSRLANQLDNLRKTGLPRLYNAVVNALK